MGRLVILGGAAMVAAAPAVPSKALRGGAEAEASMQVRTILKPNVIEYIAPRISSRGHKPSRARLD